MEMKFWHVERSHSKTSENISWVLSKYKTSGLRQNLLFILAGCLEYFLANILWDFNFSSVSYKAERDKFVRFFFMNDENCKILMNVTYSAHILVLQLWHGPQQKCSLLSRKCFKVPIRWTIHSKPIKQVKSFKYLLSLWSSICWSTQKRELLIIALKPLNLQVNLATIISLQIFKAKK